MQLIEASRLVDRSNDINQELERTYAQLREADSELHGFIITGDSSFYHEFWKARQSIRASSSRLFSAMESHSGQYQRLQELEALINYRHAVMVKVLKGVADEKERKLNTAQIRKYTALIRAKITSLQDEEQALLAKRIIIKNKRELFTPLLIFMMAVFSLAIMLFAYYKISRELVIRTWMQRELEAKNNALTNANRELEQFIFGSSHDLQEPLRKIETFCSLFVHKHLLENNIEGTRLINNIQVSARRMRDMLNNLLGYARFYSATDKKVSLSLNDVVADVLHDYQPFIEEKSAIVQVDLLPKIKGVKSQLYRLFQNLISNALKYSDKEKTPSIWIKNASITRADMDVDLPATYQGEFFRVSIEDNGIGFEQEYNDKIFLLFQRLHDKQHYDGTGIGLAICKKIVENHGGYICAKSLKNKGSVFTIYFPVISPEESPRLQHKPVSKL